LKFTEHGKVETTIEIIQKNGNEKFLKISVEDTGVGIPLENHDKLFKLFGFVQDKKELNVNGIGLGLMISKSIVENFGGKISFESQEGKGSIFMFTFKLEEIL
jgi:signal transduction histidine kinase